MKYSTLSILGFSFLLLFFAGCGTNTDTVVHSVCADGISSGANLFDGFVGVNAQRVTHASYASCSRDNTVNKIYSPYGQELFDLRDINNDNNFADGDSPDNKYNNRYPFDAANSQLGHGTNWYPYFKNELVSSNAFLSSLGRDLFNDMISHFVSEDSSGFNLDAYNLKRSAGAERYPLCLWGGDYYVKANLFSYWQQSGGCDDKDWKGHCKHVTLYFNPVVSIADGVMMSCQTTPDFLENQVKLPKAWKVSELIDLYCDDASSFVYSDIFPNFITKSSLNDAYKVCVAKNINRSETVMYILRSGDKMFTDALHVARSENVVDTSVNLHNGFTIDFSQFTLLGENTSHYSKVWTLPGLSYDAAPAYVKPRIFDNLSSISVTPIPVPQVCQAVCPEGYGLSSNLNSVDENGNPIPYSPQGQHSFLSHYSCSRDDGYGDTSSVSYSSPELAPRTREIACDGTSSQDRHCCEWDSFDYTVAYTEKSPSYKASYVPTIPGDTRRYTLAFNYTSQTYIVANFDFFATDKILNQSYRSIFINAPTKSELDISRVLLFRNLGSASKQLYGYETAKKLFYYNLKSTSRTNDYWYKQDLSIAPVYIISFSPSLGFTQKKCINAFTVQNAKEGQVELIDSGLNPVGCITNKVFIDSEKLDTRMGSIDSPINLGYSHELFMDTIFSVN